MTAATRRGGRFASALAVVVCALLAVLMTPGVASAHATVVSSNPSDGARLSKPPTQVSVTFDESVQTETDSLKVIGPNGDQVDTGNTGHGPGGGPDVVIGLHSGLRHGTYTVQWHVISADSHPVQGAFAFSIGAPTQARPGAAATPNHGHLLGVLYGVARWLGYAGIALLAGGIAFLLACWPRGTLRGGVRRLLLTGWVVLLLSTVAELLLQGPYGAGLGLSGIARPDLLRTTVSGRLGTLLAIRLPLLAASAGYLVWLLDRWLRARRAERVALCTVAVVLGVVLALTWSLAGHAATQGQAVIAVPLDVLHVLAMSVWLGGLATMTAVALRGAPDAPVAAAVARFSPIALWCVVTLIGTGLYQAWREIGSFGAVTGSVYGRLLLVKTGIVVVLIVLGALARRILATPGRRTPIALRRGVRAEAVLAAGVLAVTALLVDAAPPRTTYAVPVNASVAFDAGGSAGTGRIVVHVKPARIGPNTVQLTVTDPAGRPRKVAEIAAAFVLPSRGLGPLPVKLRHSGAGDYTSAAPVVLPDTGAWRLNVTVRTDAIDETTVSVPAKVG